MKVVDHYCDRECNLHVVSEREEHDPPEPPALRTWSQWLVEQFTLEFSGQRPETDEPAAGQPDSLA